MRAPKRSCANCLWIGREYACRHPGRVNPKVDPLGVCELWSRQRLLMPEYHPGSYAYPCEADKAEKGSDG